MQHHGVHGKKHVCVCVVWQASLRHSPFLGKDTISASALELLPRSFTIAYITSAVPWFTTPLLSGMNSFEPRKPPCGSPLFGAVMSIVEQLSASLSYDPSCGGALCCVWICVFMLTSRQPLSPANGGRSGGETELKKNWTQQYVRTTVTAADE